MLIKAKSDDLEEGIFLNKYIKNRVIRRNQNLLLAVTGTTGSGKSYVCLRVGELWYKKQFNEEFPKEHICFTIEEVMRLLSQKNKKLRKGDLIIFEEAGVNMGSLDFQNKISKMFAYVLQSFRSMNIGILMNLPVLTMLNKSARLLLHCHMITVGIDYENEVCKVKPFFHQLNQQTGKVYSKYLKVNINNNVRKVERFNYSLASEELIKEYESKKLKFVSELNEGFLEKLEAERRVEAIKMSRPSLTEKQQKVYELRLKGWTLKKIALEMEVSHQAIACRLESIKKRGFKV